MEPPTAVLVPMVEDDLKLQTSVKECVNMSNFTSDSAFTESDAMTTRLVHNM